MNSQIQTVLFISLYLLFLFYTILEPTTTYDMVDKMSFVTQKIFNYVS